MTTHYLDLLPHESLALTEGRLSAIIRLVEPQPEQKQGRWIYNIPEHLLHKGCCTSVWTSDKEWWEYLQPNQNPFGPPGTALACREEHLVVPKPTKGCSSAMKLVYRADEVDRGYKWTPARERPEEFIRHRLTVGEVTCKQFASLDEKDALSAGYQPFWDSDNPVRHKMPDGRILTGEPAESAQEAMRRTLKCEPSTWLWLCTINPHTT